MLYAIVMGELALKLEPLSWDNLIERSPNILSERHLKFVKMFARCKRDDEIEAETKLTKRQMHLLEANTDMQLEMRLHMEREVAMPHDQVDETSFSYQISLLGWESVSVVKRLLRDPRIPIRQRVKVAMWVWERNHRKPSRRGRRKKEPTLIEFMEALKTMKVE